MTITTATTDDEHYWACCPKTNRKLQRIATTNAFRLLHTSLHCPYCETDHGFPSGLVLKEARNENL